MGAPRSRRRHPDEDLVTHSLTDQQVTEVLRPGNLEHAGDVLDTSREAYRAILGRDQARDQGRDVDSRTALLALGHRRTAPRR